jgi:hypothetical protein
MFLLISSLFVFILIIRKFILKFIRQIHLAQYKYKGYDDFDYDEMMQTNYNCIIPYELKQSNDYIESNESNDDYPGYLDIDSEGFHIINKTY